MLTRDSRRHPQAVDGHLIVVTSFPEPQPMTASVRAVASPLGPFWASMDDPPPGLTGRDAFSHVIFPTTGTVPACIKPLAELRDFLAGGDDEERCRWLMDDMASMYDPLVDFASYRDCVLWVRDQLEASADFPGSSPDFRR